MLIPEQYTELPTYFAPGAFASTRAGYSDISTTQTSWEKSPNSYSKKRAKDYLQPRTN
jgi:hypothetical protein